MLGQHVITNGAIFVPFGTAICFDHAIDFIHQFRPIRLAKFLDKKIVFDCFQLALLAPSNCGRIRILDWRPSSNGNSCQKSMSGYIPHLFFRSSAYFSISSSRFLIICHFGLFYLLLSYLFKTVRWQTKSARTKRSCGPDKNETLLRFLHRKIDRHHHNRQQYHCYR